MNKNIFVVGKVAFANLIEPKYFMDGNAKYSVRLLVDKFNEKEKQKILSALKEAYDITPAIKETKVKQQKKIP